MSSNDGTPEVLYHYTSLDTLALILRNQSIRFTPLSSMDDVQEHMTADTSNIGDFVFVSCWTSEDRESIPMWSLYASLESGVRIELPSAPFETYPLTPESMGEALNVPASKVERADHTLRSVIPPKDLYNGMYSFDCDAGSPFLPCKITYTEDNGKLFPNAVTTIQNGINLDFSSLGLFKNKYWIFQKEWRYILRTLPITLSGNRDETMRHLHIAIARLLAGNLAPKFRYYDLKISDAAFAKIKITLSPKMNDGHRELAHSLLARHGLQNVVMRSELEGLL